MTKNLRENRVVIFQKNRILGKTKTRIARQSGPIAALNIYEQLIHKTQSLFYGDAFYPVIYYSDFIDTNDDWLHFRVDKRRQASNDDLGIRIYNALDDEMATNKRVVIIGTDCPYITTEHLHLAFMSLKEADFVIGPSHDGGFYLLGVNHLFSDIFENINWSTDSVCTQLKENLNRRNSSYRLLKPLHDIDHYDDWLRYVDDKESVSD